MLPPVPPSLALTERCPGTDVAKNRTILFSLSPFYICPWLSQKPSLGGGKDSPLNQQAPTVRAVVGAGDAGE